MNIVAVTRNSSLHCTTLNSIMCIGMWAIQKNIHYTVHFIQENTDLKKYLKHADRLIFLDYGASFDRESLNPLCSEFPKGYNVLVFPAVKSSIDWSAFKKKTVEGSSEPAEQRGLEFDTEVHRKISDFYYEVKETKPRIWAANPKKLKDHPLDPNVKKCAWVDAKCTMHYTHECIANILETSGIQVKKGHPG